jgi:hypothetical protein
MKKSIQNLIAGLAFVCLVLNVALPLLQVTGPAWINVNSLSLRHDFYFRRGQWLADGRTLAAAVRYLFQTRSAKSTNSIQLISLPDLPAIRPRLSTNLVVADETEPTILFEDRRLSRVDNLIVRKRMYTAYGLAPLFTVADASSEARSALPGSNWQTGVSAATVRTRLLRFATLPTNAAAIRLGSFSPNA